MIRALSRKKRASDLASVFSLHNAPSQTDGEVIPITVKAFNELAVTTVAELKRGVAFVVEGKLAYYKKPGHQPGGLFHCG